MERTRLTDERRALVETHVEMATATAQRLIPWALEAGGRRRRGDAREEAVSVAYAALVDAAARWEDTGVPFRNYAISIVWGRVWHARDKARRSTPLGGWDVAVEERGPDPGEDERWTFAPDRLGDYMGRLIEHERRVLELRYGLDGAPPRQLKQVGEMLGYSKQRACQVHDRAIGKMRRWYGVEGDARDERRAAG